MPYSWKKKYLKLTEDQKKRGVIFSSALVKAGETEEENIHEVTNDTPDKWGTIDRLSDVGFFKGLARDAGLTVTEIVRR